MDSLLALISEWHENRKITINGSSATQTIKLGEEYGELCSAIVRRDKDLIADSLGDMFVVMVAIAELEDMYLDECIAGSYEEIKDRTGHLLPNGNFVKDEEWMQ